MLHISILCSPVWVSWVALWCECARACKSCELILKGIPRISFPKEGTCDSALRAADPSAGDSAHFSACTHVPAGAILSPAAQCQRAQYRLRDFRGFSLLTKRKAPVGQPDCWKELTSQWTHLTTLKVGRKKQSPVVIFLPHALMPDVEHSLNYLFRLVGLYMMPEGEEDSGLDWGWSQIHEAQGFLPLLTKSPSPRLNLLV